VRNVDLGKSIKYKLTGAPSFKGGKAAVKRLDAERDDLLCMALMTTADEDDDGSFFLNSFILGDANGNRGGNGNGGGGGGGGDGANREDGVCVAMLQTIYQRVTGDDGVCLRYGSHWQTIGFQVSVFPLHCCFLSLYSVYVYGSQWQTTGFQVSYLFVSLTTLYFSHFFHVFFQSHVIVHSLPHLLLSHSLLPGKRPCH
jgi:hypothetical protein